MNTVLFTVHKLKELCHGCRFHFVNNANKASLFPMKLEELLLNDKITALCQTNIMSPRNYFKCDYLTTKMNIEKPLG